MCYAASISGILTLVGTSAGLSGHGAGGNSVLLPVQGVRASRGGSAPQRHFSVLALTGNIFKRVDRKSPRKPRWRATMSCIQVDTP